jgi:hypothetical protein
VARTLLSNIDADDYARPVGMAGVNGGFVTDAWTFRLTLASITLDTTCQFSACGGLLRRKITSGATLAGSYDLPFSTTVFSAALPACGFRLITTGPTIRNYLDAGCVTPGTAATTLGLYLYLGGKNAGGFLASKGYVRIDEGGTGETFFEQSFDICDLADGLVLNNRHSAHTCVTGLDGGLNLSTIGWNGTVTITRVSCS